MIIREQLKYYFKTGRLKNIEFGLTQEKLIELLGETNWKFYSGWKFYPSEVDKFPLIIKYDRIEFYFRDTAMYGIMFQPIPAPTDRGNLRCNYHRLTRKTTIETVIQFLVKNNINFEEKPAYWDDEVRLLLTEGDVWIVFDCQKKAGHYVLHKTESFIDDTISFWEQEHNRLKREKIDLSDM